MKTFSIAPNSTSIWYHHHRRHSHHSYKIPPSRYGRCCCYCYRYWGVARPMSPSSECRRIGVRRQNMRYADRVPNLTPKVGKASRFGEIPTLPTRAHHPIAWQNKASVFLTQTNPRFLCRSNISNKDMRCIQNDEVDTFCHDLLDHCARDTGAPPNFQLPQMVKVTVSETVECHEAKFDVGTRKGHQLARREPCKDSGHILLSTDARPSMQLTQLWPACLRERI